MARPTRLTAVIDRTATGEPITVRDRILTWLRTGLPFNTTVLRAGISPGTAEHWMKEASRINERLLLNPNAQLTDHERDLVDFNHELEVARAEGEARYFVLLAQLAEGGLKQTTVTEKVDRTGRVIERSTKTETTLPSERALFWMLERRYPASYAKHIVLDRTGGADPLDEQERAELVVDALEDMLREAAEARPASDVSDS